MQQERSLVELINDYLAGNNLEVPVFHGVALRLQQVLTRSNFNMEEVSKLIVADPGLTSKVLRVANSAFYTGLSKVTNIHEAVVRLGAQEVANIAMLTTQADLYRSGDELFNRTMQTLWRHALTCAVGSKWLAGKTGFTGLAQEAFLAGLLHDIGKLFLLKVVEELKKGGQLSVAPSPSLVVEILNSRHVAEGHALMQRWNMPDAYSDVVRDHHLPDLPGGSPLLAVVRLANLACNKLGIGMCPDATLVLFATQEAQLLGAKEIVLAELEIVMEDALKSIQSLN